MDEEAKNNIKKEEEPQDDSIFNDIGNLNINNEIHNNYDDEENNDNDKNEIISDKKVKTEVFDDYYNLIPEVDEPIKPLRNRGIIT